MRDSARRQDFEGLRQFFDGMKPRTARDSALSGWLQEWVLKDADAAPAQAKSHADPCLRRFALWDAASAALAQKQPIRAISLAKTLTPGDRQKALLNP